MTIYLGCFWSYRLRDCLISWPRPITDLGWPLPPLSKLWANCGHKAQNPIDILWKTWWRLERGPKSLWTLKAVKSRPSGVSSLWPTCQTPDSRAVTVCTALSFQSTSFKSNSNPGTDYLRWEVTDVTASWMSGLVFNRRISNSQLSPLPLLRGGQQRVRASLLSPMSAETLGLFLHLHTLPVLQQTRKFYPKPGSFTKGDASLQP